MIARPKSKERRPMLPFNFNVLPYGLFLAPTSARIMGAAFPEGGRQIAIEESADLIVVGCGHSRGIFSPAWSRLYSISRESLCAILSVRFTSLVGV
jgi:hypothetical protein